MKKVLLVAALAVFGFSANAQDTSFGVTAGLSNLSVDMEVPGGAFGVSDGETGFYFGVLADIGISDAFHVQPAVTYSMTGDASALVVPVMAKYYVGDSGFNIQAGPQLTYLMGDYADAMESDMMLGDDFSAMAIQLGVGAGYDINENFAVEARYAFQLNNSYSGDVDDVKLKHNLLTVGAVYKF